MFREKERVNANITDVVFLLHKNSIKGCKVQTLYTPHLIGLSALTPIFDRQFLYSLYCNNYFNITPTQLAACLYLAVCQLKARRQLPGGSTGTSWWMPNGGFRGLGKRWASTISPVVAGNTKLTDLCQKLNDSGQFPNCQSWSFITEHIQF